MKKIYLIGDESSPLALAADAAVADAFAAVVGVNTGDDDEHINDLLPLNVSLVKFSAISDAIFVNCGPMNVCSSS